MRKNGVIIVTDNDAKMIRSKHWMISRGITYRTYYLPIDQEQKKPMVLAEMSVIDRLLYRITFGSVKSEKVVAYL
jgi:hypothetical protein